MTQPTAEKAPVDASDYEGLQLDMRASVQKEISLDASRYPGSPVSPDHYQSPWSEKKGLFAQSLSAGESETWKPPILGPHPAYATREQNVPYTETRVESALGPERPRICGLRRGRFWTVLGFVLAALVIGAIIGGVLAGKNMKSVPVSPPPSSPSQAPSSNSNSTSSPVTIAPIAPGASNPFLPQSDVMVDSPLAIVAYTTNTSSSVNQQAYRLFFQSAHGNIKESVYEGGLSSWQDAHPIFTDAINNTGLAVITYMNKSTQQSSIFYVGSNGFVQEKRLYPNTTVWQPGTINKSNLKAFGNLPIPNAPGTNSGEQDLRNGWDSYRMAAVFSRSFRNGPGARLFFHTQSETGTPLVQEMIWNMSNDTWSQGHQFNDPWPNSDLTAAIDSATQTLRLFYSAGNLTLQESWLNMTEPGAVYKPGLKIPSLLAHNDASLAAISTQNETLLYYYASQGVLSIREFNITGIPGSASHPEGFTPPADAPIVAQPALTTNASQVSLYQPIGAAVSTPGSGASQTIQVFWAEGVVDAGSGYGTMKTLQRNISAVWPESSYGAGAGQIIIPLGNSNANPS